MPAWRLLQQLRSSTRVRSRRLPGMAPRPTQHGDRGHDRLALQRADVLRGPLRRLLHASGRSAPSCGARRPRCSTSRSRPSTPRSWCSSSVTCQLGRVRRRARPGRPHRPAAADHASGACASGSSSPTSWAPIFVGGQALEYAELVARGRDDRPTRPTARSSTSTTGFHGLHVTGGLIAFLFVLGRTYTGPAVHPRAGRRAPSSCPTTGTSSTWCGSACSRRSTSSSKPDSAAGSQDSTCDVHEPTRWPPLPARRRHRWPASPSCSCGLLAHRRGSTPRSPPPTGATTKAPPSRAGRPGQGALPRQLRLLPRQERRGHRPPCDGNQITARRSSASAPPPSTSRSAPAGCRWRSPGAQAPAQDGRLHRGGDRGAGRVRRLAGPRPGGPQRATSGRRLRRGAQRPSSRGGQIFRTNCTACHNFAGSGGALPRGSTPRRCTASTGQAHLRGDAHRPAEHAGLHRRQPHPRGASATSSPTSRASRRPRSTAASRSARSARSPRACSPGSSASASSSARAGLDRLRSPRPLQEERLARDERQTPHRHRGGPDRRTDAVRRRTARPIPIADPGLPAAHPAADRRRRGRLRSAPSGRSPRSSASRSLATLLFVVAYFAFDVGETVDIPVIGLRRLQRRARAHPRPVAAAASASAPSSWARKLMTDDEIVEMRHPAASTEEDRDATVVRVLADGRRGVRHRPPPAHPQLAARVRSALLAAAARRAAARPRLARRDAPAEPVAHVVARRPQRPGRGARRPTAAPHERPRERPDQGRRRHHRLGVPRHARGPAPGARDRRGRCRAPPRGEGQGRGASSCGMDPDDIESPKGRENWGYRRDRLPTPRSAPTSGARSRLYEQQTHHLLCPCHQSTFDLAEDWQGHLRSGAASPPPAAAQRGRRGLPRRRTATSAKPVGPSFWERG